MGKRKRYLKYLADAFRFRVIGRLFISDRHFIRLAHHKRFGSQADLDNPHTYNDKILWLKLNWNDPQATLCADKYLVRDFVKERIGEGYLNELIAVYDSVDDIDISVLPERFVLKCTHASGYNVICHDKHEMDWDEEFDRLLIWLKSSYYWRKREWVYRDIKPRIVCERFLGDGASCPSDYKITCCNGEPKFIGVDYDRFTDHKRNVYDTKWNFMPFSFKFPRGNADDIPRPEKLEEMLELACKLSSGFPHVRVDLYYVDERIYFGEMTFFPSSGMSTIRPPEYNELIGSWLDLPVEA